MKLNRKKLRKMILNEIKKIKESQVYQGSNLSHGFDNNELIKKIYDAVAENETEQNLMALRKTALKREALLQRDLGTTSSVHDQETFRQNIYLINQAIDHLDHHLGLYLKNRGMHKYSHDPDDPVFDYGSSSKGEPLLRRWNRRIRDGAERGYGSKKEYPDDHPRYL